MFFDRKISTFGCLLAFPRKVNVEKENGYEPKGPNVVHK